MSKVDLLFYASGILCILSFLLFAYQVRVYIQRMGVQPPHQPAAAGGGLGDAQQQALNVQQALQATKEAVEQLSKLAETFSKAGPMATTAVLCIMFAFICLLSSGLISIAVS